MDLTEVGFKIRSYRERNNIKQADLAEQLGLTISALSKIESGKQKVDAATLIAFLNISEEYEQFFEFNEKWSSPKSCYKDNNVSLYNQFSEFCREYPNIVLQQFSRHDIGRLIRDKLPLKMLQSANLNLNEYKAYGSVGIGTWASIPWIAFLNRSITNSVQKGIYVTYLFREDGKGFYLSLNQGYTFYKKCYGDEAKLVNNKVTEYLKRELRTVDDNMKLEDIDLGDTASFASAYESGHIFGKYYSVDENLEDKYFIDDFKSLMLTYKEVCGLLKGRSYEAFIESIVKFNSIDYIDEIENNSFFKSVYINSDNKNDEADIITDIDKKRIMYQMKTYNWRPKRNLLLAALSMKIANYRCEYDPEHETFITNNGIPYVEAHHLIPFREQHRFNTYLDTTANIAVLCPNCHKAIHMGSDELKEKMLRKLFYSRIEKLESEGIELTFSQLKEIYGIKN